MWRINPFFVAMAAFASGFIPFAVALQFSGIGDVAYYMPKGPGVVCDAAAIDAGQCLIKQVGYLYAINWWAALMVLLPFAMFFAFASIQSTDAVFDRMLTDKMFATPDWSARVADIAPTLRKLWRMVFFIAVPLVLAIFAIAARDWYCVVYWPLKLGVPFGDVLGDGVREALVPRALLDQLQGAGCYMPKGHENDWSVSATFGDIPGLAPLAAGTSKPSVEFAMIFSAYNYILMAIWTGLLFAYFGYVLALTTVVYNINNGRYGYQLVLNLNSGDERKRRGFERLEDIFKPCIFTAMIAFILAFLMRMQNVFLRNTEYESIYALMFEDIKASIEKLFAFDPDRLTVWFSEVLQTMRKVLDFGQFSDPQSLLGTPAIMIVLGLVAASLGYILRKAAEDAKDRVGNALSDLETAPKVTAYYRLSQVEAEKRAKDVEFWPLSWPEFNYAVRMMLMGVVCYVFYRIAFIWIGLAAMRIVQGGVRVRMLPGGRPRTPPTGGPR